MNIEALEVYSNDSNYAIIKPSGRNYPGSVIQGDTLSSLCRQIRRIRNAVEQRDFGNQEFLDEIADLNDALVGRVLHYQAVLREHGIALPFSPPFTTADLMPQQPEVDE